MLTNFKVELDAVLDVCLTMPLVFAYTQYLLCKESKVSTSFAGTLFPLYALLLLVPLHCVSLCV